jgi:chromosome partitioning protein
MPYVIAISNEKGGVAKTTSTISLGASLAEIAPKILLIDLDPQANLSLALGYEPGKNGLTSSGIILNNTPIREALVETTINDIDLILADKGLEQADQVLPIQTNYTTRLRTALEEVKSLRYQFILIDCPPSLGALTANALTAADLLIIPTQAEYFSAYALRNMMTVIKQVRATGNSKLAYRILITLLDQRNRTHNDIHEQLDRTFGIGLFKTVIEIDTKLRESPILGLPITQYRPNSRAALQYRSLAEELIQYVKQTNTEAS